MIDTQLEENLNEVTKKIMDMIELNAPLPSYGFYYVSINKETGKFCHSGVSTSKSVGSDEWAGETDYSTIHFDRSIDQNDNERCKQCPIGDYCEDCKEYWYDSVFDLVYQKLIHRFQAIREFVQGD